MGVFDTVLVPCPECGKEAEFQSKSGDSSMEVVKLKYCPDDILANVNRHAPIKCDCGTLFKVDLEKRESVKIELLKTETKAEEARKKAMSECLKN